MTAILLLSDNARLARLRSQFELQAPGWDLTFSGPADEPGALLDSRSFDAVVCDLYLAGTGPGEVLRNAAARLPGAVRVVVSDGPGGALWSVAGVVRLAHQLVSERLPICSSAAHHTPISGRDRGKLGVLEVVTAWRADGLVETGIRSVG